VAALLSGLMIDIFTLVCYLITNGWINHAKNNMILYVRKELNQDALAKLIQNQERENVT
jgi:hypothetical protein